MSQKQEKEIPEIVFILLAIGGVVGIAMCIAGLIVAIGKASIESIDFYRIFGGWIVAAISMYFFGRLLSEKYGTGYLQMIGVFFSIFKKSLLKKLKKQDE